MQISLDIILYKLSLHETQLNLVLIHSAQFSSQASP